MEFATFCNICLNTDNDVEEHENVLNILIALIGNVKFIKKSKVYLCRSCCVKVKEYENFRNICTTNTLQFRYLYFELKRKLEADEDPEMDNKLRNFINAKVSKKDDNSLYEKIEPTCAAFKDNVCSTITADSDIKYNNEIIDIKCEEKKIHSESDLEQLDPLQYNSNDIKMEDVCTMEANEENEFEHKLHTEVDLGNEVVSLNVRTTQHYSNGHSNIERAGVHAATSNKDYADAEKSLKTAIQEIEKFPIGTTSHERVGARSHSTQTLTRHDNKSIGAKSHTCNVCNKSFSQSCYLIIHQRVHNGDKPYTCNVCDKSFSRSSNLIRHQRIHTGDKPYTCNMCDKTFTVSSNLILHQRIHKGDKPFACTVCNKAFSHLSNLIRHQRIHSEDKPYTCNVCYKAFAQSFYLIKHQRIHSEDKPYTCTVCDKSFSHSSNLIRHQRIHSGYKPYTCNVCDKTFSESSKLILHQRIHNGHKPFTCRVCDKAFSDSSNLKKHQRIHSENMQRV